MPQYKLTYFDIDGGRGEIIRLALHAAGIDFEDNRISFEEFAKVRSSLRFNAVPVLELDGNQLTQTNSISRYVGKMGGLYPKDDLQALYCDEVMSTMEDLGNHIVKTFGLSGEELIKARTELADGWMTTFLKGTEALLQRGGGKYFADNKLTIADLKVYTQMGWLASGTLDHIPTDLVDRVAPTLAEHRDRIAQEPSVLAYYASRS